MFERQRLFGAILNTPYVLIGLLVLIITSSVSNAEPTVLTGTVTHVRDGDTIEVGKVPIRLNGVSAPELKEPLGQRSKKFMRQLVEGERVRCELDGTKTYDRYVGVCFRDGKDIGIAVIAAGLALDCPRYSKGHYAVYETKDGLRTIKLPKYCRAK